VTAEESTEIKQLRRETASGRLRRDKGVFEMQRYVMRVYAAAVAVVVGSLGVTGVSASASVMSRTAASPGAQLWVKLYNGPANGYDQANSVAVSPSGSTVFVTGYSWDGPLGYDDTTIAYNAATGAQQWVKIYNSPGDNGDFAYSLAVSPTGGAVFVTGVSGQYATTVAFNTSTGAQLWAKSYNNPAGTRSQSNSVTVSPSGKTVFVTGYSVTTTIDYITVAYNAATGAQVWAKRYNGTGNSDDQATSVTVSPAGSAVYVTGKSTGTNGVYDYATVAYNAATGAQLWAARYNGPGNIGAQAHVVAASPGGESVFVTGETTAGSGDYATVAHDATTGAQQWVKLYNGPTDSTDEALSMAVSSTGNAVYVTGESLGTKGFYDYATVAYNPSTGAQLWATRYNAPSNVDAQADSVAVSPTGKTVFVTGYTGGNYTTVAYEGP
jgi:6-phosphogluconolactonase (cycloisomerase 2 family)